MLSKNDFYQFEIFIQFHYDYEMSTNKDDYKNIQSLISKFKLIKEMGYVESVNNNSSGIGLTLEKLLGKKVDNFPLPDYKNIELKAKLAYSKTPISLFRLTPFGKDFYELKRIVKKYGYYTKSSGNQKYLNGSVYANIKNKIGSYYYLLNINKEKHILELYIYNSKMELIDSCTYWTFDNLEEALYRKLKILAFVTTYSTTKKNKRYYKYYKITIYKLKTFNDFLNAIENGKISVCFSVDIYKNGEKKGLQHYHGVCFRIYEKDLLAIFNKQ